MGDVVILFQGQEVRRVTHSELVSGKRERDSYLGITTDLELKLSGVRAEVPLHIGHDTGGTAYVYGSHGTISFLIPQPDGVETNDLGEDCGSEPWFREQRQTSGVHIHIVHEADNSSGPWQEPIVEAREGVVAKFLRHLER